MNTDATKHHCPFNHKFYVLKLLPPHPETEKTKANTKKKRWLIVTNLFRHGFIIPAFFRSFFPIFFLILFPFSNELEFVKVTVALKNKNPSMNLSNIYLCVVKTLSWLARAS